MSAQPQNRQVDPRRQPRHARRHPMQPLRTGHDRSARHITRLTALLAVLALVALWAEHRLRPPQAPEVKPQPIAFLRLAIGSPAQVAAPKHIDAPVHLPKATPADDLLTPASKSAAQKQRSSKSPARPNRERFRERFNDAPRPTPGDEDDENVDHELLEETVAFVPAPPLPPAPPAPPAPAPASVARPLPQAPLKAASSKAAPMPAKKIVQKRPTIVRPNFEPKVMVGSGTTEYKELTAKGVD